MLKYIETHSRASRQAIAAPGALNHTMSRLAAAALTGGLIVAISALSFTLSGSAAQAAKPTGNGGGDKTTLGSLSCTATSPFAKWNGSAWVCDVGTAGPKGDIRYG